MPPAALAKPLVARKSVSKSQKAGLTLPVPRINRFMKATSGKKRIGSSAPVYMTAVTEYITAEIMELAGNATSRAGRKTVTPEDLLVAIRGDADLSKLFAGHGIFVGDKISRVSDAIKHTPAKKSGRSVEDA